MEKGIEVARGKTKTLFELAGQPDLAVVQQGDTISAGDGVRRHELNGKGRLAAMTTSRVFRLLNLAGLPTHYVRGGEDDDENELLVRRCTMVPLEVVVRGVAAGSYTSRKPGTQRGSLLIPRVIEYFFKDDVNHDPLIESEEILARGLANPTELATMAEIARVAFEILSHAWRLREILLVDLKLEFGRIASGEGKGALVIADVIDNDSWRIWPQGREELMLDKQLYRNLQNPTIADLEQVLDAYERVTDLTGTFPVMRPAMAAVICGSGDLEPSEALLQQLGAYGIPIARHVTSMTRTPAHALSLIQQLEVAFPRVVFVAVGTPAFTEMVEFATTAPVFAVGSDASVAQLEALGLRVAKAFALDDTVLYGRVTLMENNLRSTILQADMRLNQPPPSPAESGAVSRF